jgi:mono/diheme cytochrome c family protein
MAKMHRYISVLAMASLWLACCGPVLAAATQAVPEAAGFDRQQVERGRYLARIAGCNDCHTPGYLSGEGAVPEDLWLTGDRFGWHGPWGTTYGSNLRLFVNALTEEQWLVTARTLRSRPPMPWFNLNAMHDEDLRALYQFIRYLGPAGEPAPAFVPPGQEPATPYATFPPAPGQ